MSSKPFILRWGILGCGRISGTFVRDLVLPPTERPRGEATSGASNAGAPIIPGGTDVAHAIVAVGSRSLVKAEAFAAENCPLGGWAQVQGLVTEKVVPVEGYEALVGLESVDIIYVGTPHPSHYSDCKLALEAGKHVLLEKPATLNTLEFIELSNLAKAKNLFLMEAVWTRFFPLTYALQDVIFKEGAVGELRRVVSDFSIDFVDIADESHRLINADLAGGGLLDLGPYPLVWAMLLLYQHPDNKLSSPSSVRASMAKHPTTGVDLFTDWTLDFPKIGTVGARASLSVSIGLNSPKECVTRIQGNKGEIILPWATARPDRFTIRRSVIGRGPQDYTEEVREFPIQGMGLNWEADAVARCIRDGKVESERMPHSETVLTMQVLDEVRRQGGYVYPEGLEKVKLAMQPLVL